MTRAKGQILTRQGKDAETTGQAIGLLFETSTNLAGRCGYVIVPFQRGKWGGSLVLTQVYSYAFRGKR